MMEENVQEEAPVVTANDSEDPDNHHSLPTPEEVNSDRPRRRDLNPIWIGVFVLLLTIFVVALSVGLTSDKRQSSKGDSNAVSNDPAYIKKRKTSIQNWIVNQNISPSVAFSTGSPQQRALDWMTEDDALQLKVPDGSKSSSGGYKFMSRYVLAVTYYALNGPQWNYKLEFLSRFQTCDWFNVFGDPVGQVGVLCDDDQTVTGLSLSKCQLFLSA